MLFSASVARVWCYRNLIVTITIIMVLRYTTDSWFSRLLWHPARKWSGSILTTPEPTRGPWHWRRSEYAIQKYKKFKQHNTNRGVFSLPFHPRYCRPREQFQLYWWGEMHTYQCTQQFSANKLTDNATHRKKTGIHAVTTIAYNLLSGHITQ